MTFLHGDPATRIGFGHNARATLAALRAGIRSAFATYHQGQARIAAVRRLEAMSDAKLAERGIARDRIVHFVFRDLFGT